MGASGWMLALSTTVTTIVAPEKRARLRMGPPTPHPTSRTRIPGARASHDARKC